MDLQNWINEMKAQIKKLEQIDLGYTKSANEFLPAADVELLDEIERQRNTKLPEEFRTFYQTIGGLNLIDIYNGYRIHPLKFLIRTHEIPIRIAGTQEDEILTFGSDGGGNYFAMRLDESGEVLCMAIEAIVEDSIYYEDDFPVKTVGSSFYGYLERLLADTKAYINDDRDWIYMEDEVYGK
jgi:hypothetical protein